MESIANPTRLMVLQFIKNYIDDNGWAPTVREIMPVVGNNSTSNVLYHLNNLQTDGLIRREPFKARAMAVTDEGKEALYEWLSSSR